MPARQLSHAPLLLDLLDAHQANEEDLFCAKCPGRFHGACLRNLVVVFLDHQMVLMDHSLGPSKWYVHISVFDCTCWQMVALNVACCIEFAHGTIV